MPEQPVKSFVREAQGWALVALPAALILVFVLHFHALADFFVLKWRYVPRPPELVVPRLVMAANRWPMIHDPHVLAYLALPLVPLCALGLYALARTERPVLARLGLAASLSGTVYLGGLFGMWTAFYRGLGDVDPRFIEGAVATFASMTALRGAFLLTTQLAKLALIGLGLQALALWSVREIPRWAPIAAACGCALILAFWDLDNLMLIGAMLMLVGFIPVRARLSRMQA